MNEHVQKNWIMIVLVIAVIICAIAVYMNQKQLPAYIDEYPVENSSSIPETNLPTMETYTDNQTKISFDRPSSWRQITMDGNITFIDTDGTYLMLQISEYRPTINMATESSVLNELTATGNQPLSFTSLSTSAFSFSYQTGSILTFEYVTWDLNNECRLIFSTEAGKAETMSSFISHIYNSFQWDKSSPIPEDVRVFYNGFGSFEFAYPAAWESKVSNEAFSAINKDTGSLFCVTVSKSNKQSLSGLSELQYVQMVSQSRSNLFIKRYTASDIQITAESIYSTNQGIPAVFYHVILLEDGFQYEFLLDTPVDTGEEDYLAIQECLKFFRVF